MTADLCKSIEVGTLVAIVLLTDRSPQWRLSRPHVVAGVSGELEENL